MIANDLHIPPYMLGELTIDQARTVVMWCEQEHARREEQGR